MLFDGKIDKLYMELSIVTQYTDSKLWHLHSSENNPTERNEEYRFC